MKHLTDKRLLAGFFLSLLVWLLNLWALRFPLPDGLLWLSVFQMYLAAGLHGLPAFCIQLFLLRTPQRRPLAALPVLLLLGWLLLCFLGLMSVQGDNWAPILWFLRIFAAAPPAIGTALARVAARAERRGGGRHAL